MISQDLLEQKFQKLDPQTVVHLVDLTGGQDHYRALIISPAFNGLKMIEQHRLALSLVQSEIDTGELHAITLKTFTPKQFEKYGSSPNPT